MSREKSLIGVRLAGLSEGVHEFEFACQAADFRDLTLAESLFPREILVKATVEKMENELIVTLKTTTIAALSCDRCLTPLPVELNGSYRLFYGYEQPGEAGEERYKEYHLIDRKTLSLDLTEDVRETLLLSVPMKVTCTDNPDCGVFHAEEKPKENNEAAVQDSRWQESLEKLKNKYR